MVVDRRVGVTIIVIVVAILLLAALANNGTRFGNGDGNGCPPAQGQVDKQGCPGNGEGD